MKCKHKKYLAIPYIIALNCETQCKSSGVLKPFILLTWMSSSHWHVPSNERVSRKSQSGTPNLVCNTLPPVEMKTAHASLGNMEKPSIILNKIAYFTINTI